MQAKRALKTVADKEPIALLGTLVVALSAAVDIMTSADVKTWEQALVILVSVLVRSKVDSPETRRKRRDGEL